MRFCYYCQRIIERKEDEDMVRVGKSKVYGHKDCFAKMVAKDVEEFEEPIVSERYDEFVELCKVLNYTGEEV